MTKTTQPVLTSDDWEIEELALIKEVPDAKTTPGQYGTDNGKQTLLGYRSLRARIIGGPVFSSLLAVFRDGVEEPQYFHAPAGGFLIVQHPDYEDCLPAE